MTQERINELLERCFKMFQIEEDDISDSVTELLQIIKTHLECSCSMTFTMPKIHDQKDKV